MTTEQSGLGALATHKRRNWARLVWAAIFLAFADGWMTGIYVV